MPWRLAWHDTPEGALLEDGVVLCRVAGSWRLSRGRAAWMGATLVAEARDLVALAPAVPDGVGVRAEWEGTRRRYRWPGADGSVVLEVLDGRFSRRGPVPACRLSLDGPAEAVAGLAALLVPCGAAVPQATLAQEAMQVPGALPDAALQPLDAAQAAGPVLAEIIGRQLRILLHWAERIPGATGPEPVHQMRVATRRLRAALSTFKRVAACPALAEIAGPLKDCAARLGAARDWDVFLDGAGLRLARAFPDDPRCAAMLRSGVRRRRAMYGALRLYLAGPGFRGLAIGLAHAAAVRPWPDGPAMAGFAAHRLRSRLRAVRRAGRDIGGLPVEALHELRKDCKRLRYTAEFFQPLYGARRTKPFLHALADLQEELGLLNDGTAISGLMAQLGRADRGYAAGLAEGFTAAQAGVARGRILKVWRRFEGVKPFWRSSSKSAKPLISNEGD